MYGSIEYTISSCELWRGLTCVLVFIDDVSVTAQLKYVTPSIHATQYVPRSFHWNLAYVEMLWEKNIVRSLKSAAEVALQNMVA